jgi:hypothetical protein
MNYQDLINQAEGNQEIINFINNQVKASEKKGLVTSQQEVEHIIDFLKSTEAPSRLIKAAYETMRDKASDWVARMNRKGIHVMETEEDTKVMKRWNTGMKLVKLVGKAAFAREGALMHHCVKSYHDKKGSDVYSLRDENNNPHATIEVTTTNGQINQIKGKGNGSIHPKYIKYVLSSLKLLGHDVRLSEMGNLGYMELSADMWKLLDAGCTDLKFLMFKGSRLLYKGSKIEITNEKAIENLLKASV